MLTALSMTPFLNCHKGSHNSFGHVILFAPVQAPNDTDNIAMTPFRLVNMIETRRNMAFWSSDATNCIMSSTIAFVSPIWSKWDASFDIW